MLVTKEDAHSTLHQGAHSWRPSTKCVRVKNLPSQWAEDPEKAQRTLRDLLETRAHLTVSQVIIKRTNLYQQREGMEEMSFAHVWLSVTAAHDKILEDITALTVQGKNLRAAWYPPQRRDRAFTRDHDERPQMTGPETPGRPGTAEDGQSCEPRGSGLNRIHDHSCQQWQQLLIPHNRDGHTATDDRPVPRSKWLDTESFQAVLQGDHQVLLTTIPMTENNWVRPDTFTSVMAGTMWGYEAAYRRQMWTAHAEHEDILSTHRKAQAIRVSMWIGFLLQVRNPKDIQIDQISIRKSQAFIKTVPDQIITCIAPPIWVWSDISCTAGAWCIIATTYVDYWDDPSFKGEQVHTGLVPMSTLMPHHGT